MKRSDVTIGKNHNGQYIIVSPNPVAYVLNPRLAACTTAEEADAVLDAFFAVLDVPVPNEVTLMLPVTFYIKGDDVHMKSVVHPVNGEFFGSWFGPCDLGPLYADVRKAGCRDAQSAMKYLATRPERLCTSPATQ